MRLKLLWLFLLLSCARPAFSQPTFLLPIDNGLLPADSSSIAAFTPYIDTSGHFTMSGFQVNDSVPDFTVFDVNGNAARLSTMLSNGKPVLLVIVSYSCPASRHSMQFVLPDILINYGPQINVCLVYTLEAHPVGPDYSPFSDTVWTMQANFTDSVLLPQARTYLQRKTQASAFQNDFAVPVPVYLDGPSNEFWSTFGPAPNNAYLIGSNGLVYKKYGWFDHSRNVMLHDLSTYFLTTNVNAAASQNSVSLYPNPSSGETTLSVNKEQFFSYQLSDLSGRKIESAEQLSGNTTIDTSMLDAGMYFITVQTASGKTYSLPYIRE